MFCIIVVKNKLATTASTSRESTTRVASRVTSA